MKKTLKTFLFIFIFQLVFCSLCFAQHSLRSVEVSSKDLIGSDIKERDVLNKDNYFWVIYDNVCPYCRKATKHIKTLDWEGKFKFLSYRDPLAYKLFPHLSQEECEKDVHMVTPDGKVLAGYNVFRAIIDNLTATKLLNPLLQNDYAETQLNEIYEKMVKERSCYYEESTCELRAENKKNIKDKENQELKN